MLSSCPCDRGESPALSTDHGRNNVPHPTWLSRVQAAQYANVSVATIDRAIKAGRLRAKKPDGRVLIHRTWVDKWVAAT